MAEKPSILLYTALLSATGGGQHALARLAVRLAARGYRVHVLTEPPFSSLHPYVRWLEEARVPIELLPPHRMGRVAAALSWVVRPLMLAPWAVLRARNPHDAWRSLGEIASTAHGRMRKWRIRRSLDRLSRQGSTVLHIWGPSGLTPELLKWASRRQVPAIYHEMGEADAKYVRTWNLQGTTEALGGASCVVCCSRTVAQNIASVYGFNGLVHTIPFPVDDPPVTWVGRTQAPRTVFGAIGRLVAHKRHADLVRAVRRLTDTGCPVELLIAGAGPARPDLERLVRDLGLEVQVTFTGEFSSLPEIMARFDVFALVSESESQCMPITESMAYGKAVIAARFGGMPDFVEHERTGLLVDLGDFEGLVEAMRRLATDPVLRESMGREGRARFERDYREDLLIQRFEEVYADTMTPRAARP